MRSCREGVRAVVSCQLVSGTDNSLLALVPTVSTVRYSTVRLISCHTEVAVLQQYRIFMVSFHPKGNEYSVTLGSEPLHRCSSVLPAVFSAHRWPHRHQRSLFQYRTSTRSTEQYKCFLVNYPVVVGSTYLTQVAHSIPLQRPPLLILTQKSWSTTYCTARYQLSNNQSLNEKVTSIQ